MAYIALDARDDDLFHQACTRLLTLAEKPEGKSHRNTAAWTAIFRPLSAEESERTVKLARDAVTANPQSYSEVNTLGAALYRAGEWDECIQVLEKAVTLHGKGGTRYDWVFLAFAHHQRKNAEQAEQWLQKVRQVAAEPSKTEFGNIQGSDFSTTSWSSRAGWSALRREVDEVFSAPTK